MMWRTAGVIALAIHSVAAWSADVCKDASSKALSQIDATYAPKIDLWIKVSKAMQDKGLDPRKYPVVMPDGSIEILDLLDVVDKLTKQRVEGYRRVSSAEGDCEKQIEPYQRILDIGTFFATGGLSLVLPQSMTHVDASQILSGHPLGGDKALIPQLREQLLNGFGIGGDVACAIRDPLRAARGQC